MLRYIKKEKGKNMSQTELTELWDSIESIIYSSTKEEGKIAFNRLKVKIAKIQTTINNPYLKNKLNEVISYALEASGRVSHKEHMSNCAQTSWYVFENGVLAKNRKESL